MVSDLRSLIRIAKSGVDDRQRSLAALLRKAETLDAERAALDQALQREREAAGGGSNGPGGQGSTGGDVIHGLFLGAYAAATAERRHGLEQASAGVEREIGSARSELGDAFRELRALELTEEARDRRRAHAAARREQATLDEIGLRRHASGGTGEPGSRSGA